MKVFEARFSPWRLLLLALFGAGFVVLGLWMTGLLGPPMKPGKEWVGWMSILFFGPCTLIIASRIFDTDTQVRIDNRGIHDKRWSEQTIPWNQITDVSVWSHKRQNLIVLHLLEPQLYPAIGWTRFASGANRRIAGGDVTINMTGTDGSFKDALRTIEQFRGI